MAVGNRTKPPLSEIDGATHVSLRSITGIVEYEPSEFTFTARAGTTLAEIEATLAEKNQYLPFDPPLVDAGATIGGTVAAGLSGPGRFRYGGIRDFLLGVRFLSGDGKWINSGGKVVKNAAGFDIPKFLVGSLGRLGVMTELTFKVFPRPIARQTLCVRCGSASDAIDRIAFAARARWELDAIDYRPAEDDSGDHVVYLRIAGPPKANAAIANEVSAKWGGDVSELEAADEFWHSVRELSWSSDAPVAVKVPTTPAQFADLHAALHEDSSISMQLSVAGNLLWLLAGDDSLSSIDGTLKSLGISALAVRGEGLPRIGTWNTFAIESAVKQAIDPVGTFCSF